MQEPDAGAQGDEVATAPEPRPRRRKALMISAIGGGLIAALVITAAVVVPRIVQTQRVQEYTALATELQQTFDVRAVAETTLEAAIALTVAQYEEARGLAERIAELGDTPEPILTAERAESLAEAGADAAEAIGEDPDVEDRGVALYDALAEAVQQLQEEDEQARAAADEADEEVPSPVAPASYLSTELASAVSIMDEPVEPERVDPVADDDVTDEVIDDITSEIEAVRAEVAQLEGRVDDEREKMEGFAEAIAGTLPVLQAAASEAPAQAQRVVEHTEKAPKASEEVKAAGARLEGLAESEDVAELRSQIASYVSAAETAQEKHEEVVQREERERQERERQEREARQRANSGGGGGGGSTQPQRLCSRYQAGWFGSPGQLVLLPC